MRKAMGWTITLAGVVLGALSATVWAWGLGVFVAAGLIGAGVWVRYERPTVPEPLEHPPAGSGDWQWPVAR